MKPQAFSAETTSLNNLESDKRRFVLHNVTCSIGELLETVQIYAEAPDHAIRLVNNMEANEYNALRRV